MANLKYKLKMRWYNLLSILKRQEFIEYRGLKFRTENLNYIVRGQLYSGTYEKDEVELIEYYIRPNYTVLELGGGIGVTSCIINRILFDEYKSKQVSVEAGLDIFDELEMNKYHNDCKFKHLLGVAFNNKAVDKFIIQSDILKFKPLTHKVRVLDLNEYQILNNTKFDTLVLDIEGCEWNFLTSFKLDNVHTIIVEMHPEIIGKNKVKELKKHLTDQGFYEVDHINNNFVFKRT